MSRLSSVYVPAVGVGCGGVDWESPSLLPSLWCGVWWVGIPLPSSSSVVWGLVGGNPPPSPLWCGVWWGRVRAGSLGELESVVLPEWGLEASLVHQTIFCGGRFLF